MPQRDLWAVVPCKDFDKAKLRLSKILQTEERRVLAQAMLEDVLWVLSRVNGLAGIVVVTRDPVACELAETYGARVLTDMNHGGQNSAICLAARILADENNQGIMAVSSDVPGLTTSEVEQLIAIHGDAPAVTLVPALFDLGSNAIVCSPAEVIPMCFGDHSYLKHLAAARDPGISVRTIVLPGLGHDIDRPEDLLDFISEPSQTRTFSVLQAIGVVDTLRLRLANGPLTSQHVVQTH